MSILVTGAGGLIGSHLCKRLLTDGQRVIGLSYSNRNRAVQKDDNFLFCEGDILDGKLMEHVIKEGNVKTVFHLAAHMPYTPGKNLIGVNIQGTLNVLNAAFNNGVKEFVYASSLSVYSTPPAYLPVNEYHPTQPSNVYGVTKLAGELLCRGFFGSMKTIILRFAGVYGVGMDNRAVAEFVRCALVGQPLAIYGNGEQSSDFVHVDDAVQGAYLAWKKNESSVYNIGSGEEVTIKNLAHKIVRLTNSKSCLELSSIETDRPFAFVSDIAKAQSVLGYTPHSLDDGLRLYIEQVQKG